MSDTPPVQARPRRSLSGSLLYGGGAYTAARLLPQALSFVLLPLYAHLLGSAGYGLLETLTVVKTVVGLVLLQGFGYVWQRLRVGLTDPAEIRTFESTTFWYLLLSGLVGSAVIALAVQPLRTLLTPGLDFWPLWAFALAAGFLTVFCTVIERKYQAEQRVMAFVAYTSLRALGTLAATLVFVVWLRHGALGRFEAEVLMLGVGAVVGAWLLRPAHPRHASLAVLRKGLAFGLPLLPHNLAAMVNSMLDRILITAMLGLSAAGVYSMGYRVAGAGFLVMTSFNQAMTPLFIRHMQQARDAADEGRAADAAHAYVRLAELGLSFAGLGAACALGAACYTREAIAALATAEFFAAWQIAAPIAAGVFLWTCHAAFVHSITFGTRSIRVLPLITVLGAAVNVVGNLVLNPWLGIVGAAWATTASNAVLAVLALYVGMRAYPVPYAWSRWALLSAITALGLSAAFWLDAGELALWPRLSAKTIVLLLSLVGVAKVTGLSLRALWNARRRPAQQG